MAIQWIGNKNKSSSMKAVFLAATLAGSSALMFSDTPTRPAESWKDRDSSLTCIDNVDDKNAFILTGYKSGKAVRMSTAMEEYLRDIEKRDPSALKAILDASETTGVDFELMLVTGMIESSLGRDMTPRGLSSSAVGLYQYIRSTWFTEFGKFGAAYQQGKYKDLAAEVKYNKYGVGYVDDLKTRNEILQLRRDHHLAAFVRAMYIKHYDMPIMKRALNRDPGITDFYIFYFLGQGDATKFFKNLEDNPNGKAAYKLNRAARSNRPLFYSGKKALSFQEVYDKIDGRISLRHDRALRVTDEAMEESGQTGKCTPAIVRLPKEKLSFPTPG